MRQPSKNVGGVETKKSGVAWDKIIPLVFTVLSLIISGAAYRNSWMTRQDALNKEVQEQQQVQSQKQQADKHQAYLCYLLGKQLWMVEQAYVQAPFKRKVLDLPENIAQTVRVQEVVLIGHELGLDVQPFLTSVYNNKVNILDLKQINANQERGIDATADALATTIQAKYHPTDTTAFQVGRDVGWLTFINDLRYDNAHYLSFWASDRKKLKLLPSSISHGPLDGSFDDTAITQPMEETARRLNKQVAAWGLSFEFGYTQTSSLASDPSKVIITTLPFSNRSQEIHDFTARIDQYLKP